MDPHKPFQNKGSTILPAAQSSVPAVTTLHCAGADRQPVVMETICCMRPTRILKTPEHTESRSTRSQSCCRDLVLSCHLRPLDKKDKDGAPRRQPWNPVAPSNK
ncbi:coiled-coil domain-containing protein 103 isoform X1 [Epinephelus moara]|uniref:coiled-coil domain-containing protein 103 isoform X1 n=1 Tax=Epinephelus moara TaxID=300413 RepID=UPI00214EE3C0|nr:coiled-coil domain-containing protein 103 isoform X1 [Epinephelus moara]